MTLPTIERVLDVLEYDPRTGVFLWKKPNKSKARPGDRAGCLDSSYGYRVIWIDQQRIFEHRLAWFYVHGSWPQACIDHANGVRDDNRLENLRQATITQNVWNSAKWRRNKSGFKGVSFVKGSSKWQANIRINGRKTYLGSFASPEAAHEAYKAAAEKHRGKFARAA